MTRLTKNGVTTTNVSEQEQYEYFISAATKKRCCHYDYRHTDGELFSCVKKTLELCRAARDAWIENKREVVR